MYFVSFKQGDVISITDTKDWVTENYSLDFISRNWQKVFNNINILGLDADCSYAVNPKFNICCYNIPSFTNIFDASKSGLSSFELCLFIKTISNLECKLKSAEKGKNRIFIANSEGNNILLENRKVLNAVFNYFKSAGFTIAEEPKKVPICCPQNWEYGYYYIDYFKS